MPQTIDDVVDRLEMLDLGQEGIAAQLAHQSRLLALILRWLPRLVSSADLARLQGEIDHVTGGLDAATGDSQTPKE